MAVTNVTTGLTAQPQTTTASYADVLAATTTSGTYVFETDLSDMIAGDIVEMIIYMTLAGGGTEQVSDYAVYSHVQAQPIKRSIPIPLVSGDTIRFRIRHGTGSSTVITRTRAMTVG